MVMKTKRGPDGIILKGQFPFWHQIIDYLPFEDLTKVSQASHHMMKEATHNHIFSKYDKAEEKLISKIDNENQQKSNLMLKKTE